MGKSLTEMTLEELWQLFPIVLTPHRDCWEQWYREEEEFLKTILPENVRPSHIGSTAIPGIAAKPIVDILLTAPAGTDLKELRELLCENGYICMSESPNRISLNKGYTENGYAERVFHLHIHFEGDAEELRFRDYLLRHPRKAREYEKLKLSLWKRYEHDRDGYTEAKGEFIRSCLREAGEEDGAGA